MFASSFFLEFFICAYTTRTNERRALIANDTSVAAHSENRFARNCHQTDRTIYLVNKSSEARLTMLNMRYWEHTIKKLESEICNRACSQPCHADRNTSVNQTAYILLYISAFILVQSVNLREKKTYYFQSLTYFSRIICRTKKIIYGLTAQRQYATDDAHAMINGFNGEDDPSCIEWSAPTYIFMWAKSTLVVSLPPEGRRIGRRGQHERIVGCHLQSDFD